MQNQKLCILIGLQQKSCLYPPSKFLKKGALVILCSHGGNTNETVNAAKLAKERGAAVITMTHNPNSICAQEDMNPVVYSWEDDTNEKERPQGIVMRVLNELMKLQEPSYTKYEAVLDGLEKADGIVRAAVKKVQNRTWVFAEKYFEEPFLYIMALVLLIHRHMVSLSVLFRKCSGWIAAICIPANISMDHSSAQMKTISTFFLWEQVQPELWMNEHLLS